MTAVREHRVAAFCDWLETIPPAPPFHQHPAFRFYADMTQAEFDAAGEQMRERAKAARREVDALRAELERRRG